MRKPFNYRLAFEENPDCLHNTAVAYMESQQYQKAISLFEEQLKKQPDDKKCLISLGYINFQLSKFEQATSIFDECL